MEGLPGRRKHLRIFFGSDASPENSQHLPQGPSEETDSNINTLGLRSTYSQCNNLAPCKTETKAMEKTRYKARQVRQKERIRVSLILKSQKLARDRRSIFLAQKTPDSLQWQVDYLQFDLAKS